MVWFVAGWSIDQANIVIEIQTDVLFVKLLRSDLCIAMEVLIFVAHFKIECLRRFTETDAENAVDFIHHRFFLHAKFIDRSPGFVRFAEGAGKFTKFFCHISCHFACCRRAGCLRHRILRDETVFADNAAQHIPLTTVSERVCKKVGDQSSIYRFLKCVKNAF